MRNFILISTILITGWVHAQTAAMQVLVDDLNKKTGVVLEAWIEEAPITVGKSGTLYAGKIAWVELSNGIVSLTGHEVIVKVTVDENQQITTQTAYWVNGLPEPLKEETPADPLGTDKEILTAVGGNIVKAEIERHAVVGDVAPSATVYGYREIDGKPVEFKVVVYSKGGVLVSNEPTDKATVSAEAIKP